MSTIDKIKDVMQPGSRYTIAELSNMTAISEKRLRGVLNYHVDRNTLHRAKRPGERLLRYALGPDPEGSKPRERKPRAAPPAPATTSAESEDEARGDRSRAALPRGGGFYRLTTGRLTMIARFIAHYQHGAALGIYEFCLQLPHWATRAKIEASLTRLERTRPQPGLEVDGPEILKIELAEDQKNVRIGRRNNVARTARQQPGNHNNGPARRDFAQG